jgi:hypothetical protein
MSRDRPSRSAPGRLRVWTGAALVALASMVPSVALVFQWRELWRAFSSRSVLADALERQTAPLADAARDLPTVGYFPPRGEDKGAEGARRRFLTQYAVAPTLVIDGSAEPVAIGDCVGVAHCGDVVRDAGYEIERDLGNGWLLLRRRAP